MTDMRKSFEAAWAKRPWITETESDKDRAWRWWQAALAHPAPQDERWTAWRHKKRGTTYNIVGVAEVQAEDPLTEAEITVVYRCREDGSLWVRRKSEFYDGRFEELAAQTPAPGGEEITQHIGWLKQFVHGMNESNWRDMKLRAERQLNELAAAVRLPAVTAGWQPIDTAPRDGQRILATGGGLANQIEIISYNEKVGCWNAEADTLDDYDDEPEGYSRPTHWQTLPASPATENSKHV